jgi:DNA-binding transcriptional LysR family regulator
MTRHRLIPGADAGAEPRIMKAIHLRLFCGECQIMIMGLAVPSMPGYTGTGGVTGMWGGTLAERGPISRRSPGTLGERRNSGSESNRKPATKRASNGFPESGVVTDSFIRPTFTLEQIRTFLAVASREHVTHAAQTLRLSQPAVTQQVQLLERALGIRLLERIGRNVRLTGAGVEVAGACLLIMRALENLEDMVQALRGLDRGSITMGASELAASYYLPPALTEFAATHPGIQIGVVVAPSDEVCQEVAAGNLECGLVDGLLEALPNLVRTEVARTDVLLVANRRHKLVGHAECPNDLLRDARFLAWGPGSPIEAMAANRLGDYYDRASQLFVGSMDAARRSLLTSSSFLAAMPAVAVSEDLASGALVQIPGGCGELPVHAVRRQGPDNPSVEAIWQTLIRHRERPD